MTPLRFVCPRPVDLLALGRLASVAEGWCLERPDDEALGERGLAVRVSLEARLGRRQAWSSGDLDRIRAPVPSLRYDQPGPARQPDPRAALDDKVSARRLLAGAGLPAPRWRVVSPAELCHDGLAASVSVPYVIQAARGSGGSTTWLCDTTEQLAALRPRLGAYRRLLVSSFVSGPVLNVHLLITNDHLIVSAPSLQIHGSPELSANPVAYCGADFAAAGERGLSDESVRCIAGVARLAHRVGARGLVGVDFIESPDGPVVLELNPRYQASTWLLAELESRAGLVGVGEWQARMAIAGTTVGPISLKPSLEQRPPVRAATITIRAARDLTVGARMPTGLYAWPACELTFVAPGFGAIALDHAHVVIDGSPAVEHVSNGGVLARATGLGPFVDARGTLLDTAKQLICSARAYLEQPSPAVAGPARSAGSR